MTARAPAALVPLALVLASAPASAAEIAIGSLTVDASLPGAPEHVVGTPEDVVRLLAGSTIRVVHPRSLAIRARRLVVEPGVLIDASGTPGSPGRDAPQEQTTWISSGPQHPTDVAHERWAEAVQGQLARDLDGDNGGPGRPGAKISIVVGAIEGAENLTIDVSGGEGGPGGKGGKGRKLVCGSPGPAHRDHWQDGEPGRAGRPGPRGARASVEIAETDEPPDAPMPPVHLVERPAPIPRRDYALVVSGGSSLGAYEAGYTWAFLRTLKVDRDLPLSVAAGRVELDPFRPPSHVDGRARLVGVAGASAGSINALLSAMTWCQGEAWDSSESATDNLFWSTWVGIGFTDLFPGPDARYGLDDGVFTRAAFDRVKQNILDRLHGTVRRGGAGARQFVPGCRLRLGVAVTRRTPDTVEHAGMALPRARFLTAVEATAEDDGLGFHRVPASSLAASGDWLHLDAEPGSDRVPPEELISALEASSAIPWVFSPKQLRFCSEVVGDRGRTSFACPDPGRAVPEFVDGGVFDNLPIGLALAFRPAPERGGGAAEEFHVVALDPDRRRSLAAAPDEAGPAGKKGLDNVVAWAKGFVNVSRKYELRTLFETPAVRLSDDRLDYSGRFAPVYGSEAMAFGAFFLRGFREFDYHAGVYDALLDLTLQTCRDLPETGNDDELVRCLVQGMHRRMSALALQGDTAYVAKRLLSRELACIHSSPSGLRSALQRYPLANGAATVTFQQWLDDTGQPSPAIGVLADEALRLVDGSGGACRQLSWSEVPGARGGRLTAAAAAVRRRDPSAITPAERPFAEHPAEFTTDTVADVLERMGQLERNDGNATGMRAADLGGLGVETYARVEGVGTARTPLTLPPHAPKVTAILPYYFSAGRLFELGWRPLHRQNAYLGVGVPFVLRWNDIPGAGGENFTVGAGAALTFPLSWARPNTLLGRIAPWGLTAVEVSSVATWCAAESSSVPVGGEVAIYGLAGKLRVALGRTDLFGGRDVSQLRGSRTYVGVGVADLGGLLYWGWKALTANGG